VKVPSGNDPRAVIVLLSGGDLRVAGDGGVNDWQGRGLEHGMKFGPWSWRTRPADSVAAAGAGVRTCRLTVTQGRDRFSNGKTDESRVSH
jgi:hypothetical protein